MTLAYISSPQSVFPEYHLCQTFFRKLEMFGLLNFNVEDPQVEPLYGIYPIDQVEVKAGNVFVKTKCGKYLAVFIAQHENYKCLELLAEFLKGKVSLRVNIEKLQPNCSLSVCEDTESLCIRTLSEGSLESMCRDCSAQNKSELPLSNQVLNNSLNFDDILVSEADGQKVIPEQSCSNSDITNVDVPTVDESDIAEPNVYPILLPPLGFRDIDIQEHQRNDSLEIMDCSHQTEIPRPNETVNPGIVEQQETIDRNEIPKEPQRKITILEDIILRNQTPLLVSGKTGKKNLKKGCKKNFCIFCCKLVTNFNRHMREKHKNEPRVKEIVSSIDLLPSREKSRRYHRKFSALRNEGNTLYNKNHPDSPIPVQYSNKPQDTYYVICEKCHGYFSRKGLRNHIRNNCMKTYTGFSSYVAPARVKTFPINHDASDLLKEEVLVRIKKGERQDVIFNDPTIIFYGNYLVKKLCSSVEDRGKRYIYIGNELRLLADIFVIMKEKVDPLKIKQVRDIFWPDQYENLIKAIKIRAKYNSDTGCIVSSVPGRVCTTLKKVTEILRCNLIKLPADTKESYQEEDNHLKNFEYLLTQLMSYDITRIAGDNRIRQQRSKCEILPTTRQIADLMSSIQEELDESYAKARNSFSFRTYSRLARAIMCFIMVFNRRRPGDCEKTLTEEYQNLSKCDSEFIERLSDEDKTLAQNFGRYKAQGKLNKKAANLVISQLYDPIDFLLQNRNKIGIKPENPFLFANSKSTRSPYFAAGEALRHICIKYNHDPTLLTATKLRKHLASSTSHLRQNTQDLISEFMGHSVAVHKNIYQQKELHTDVITMGRILMEAAGLSQNTVLKDITPENAELNNPPSAAWLTDKDLEDLQDDDDDFTSSPEISDENICSSDSTYQNKCTHSPSAENNKLSNAIKKRRNSDSEVKKKKRIIKVSPPLSRKRWTTPQKRRILTIFKPFIQRSQLPGISVVTNLLRKFNYEESPPQRVRELLRNTLKKETDEQMIKNHWTTEEIDALKKHFHRYFDLLQEHGYKEYPSLMELEEARATVPLLKEKNCSFLRSKLQHLFSKTECYK